LPFASTGTKDKSATDTLYIAGLATPNTVNIMPGTRCWPSPITGPSPDTLPRDGGDAEASLAAHASAGIDLAALAAQLQTEGVKGFADSRDELLNAIEAKSKVLA